MHPELWRVPGSDFIIPTYGFVVVVGFLLAVWLAVSRARRVGADPAVVTSMAAIGGLTGVLGSRGMHLVHYYWDSLTAGQMDAGEVLTTLAGGGEILGGVVLAAVCVTVYLAVARKSIGLYLDVVFPPMILAMALGRVGCLMYGCCWGQVCQTAAGDPAVPWAVRFPYGSPAHLTHWRDGLLEVPGDLLWRPLGAEQRRPIPRKLLNDPTLSAHTDLARYVIHLESVALLSKSDPNHPEIEGHRARLRELEPRLPGGSKRERAGYVAAAVHLHKVAVRDGDTAEGALANLRRLAATQRSRWVHPTQLYDAIGLSILFALLSVIFYQRQRHGLVVAWTMVLYSVSRFLMETIRGDNPHDVAGLTVSQFISLVVFVAGLVYMLVLVRYLPPQSPQVAAGVGRTEPPSNRPG